MAELDGAVGLGMQSREATCPECGHGKAVVMHDEEGAEVLVCDDCGHFYTP